MYTVRIDHFEGPLDLLLFLVRKNEIDIQQIPVLLITQQYIDYIEMMRSLNLEIAGEFLVMAATLLYLKSRALLPKDINADELVDGQSTLEELKRQLLEYQRYREAAHMLKEQNILEKDVFARAKLIIDDAEMGTAELEEVNLFALVSAFKSILERSAEKGVVFEVNIEEICVKDKINEILEKLQNTQDALSFERLFDEASTRIVVVTTFLALLELIKMQAIKIYQNRNFGRIYIYQAGSVHSFTSEQDEQQEQKKGDL